MLGRRGSILKEKGVPYWGSIREKGSIWKNRALLYGKGLLFGVERKMGSILNRRNKTKYGYGIFLNY